MLVQIVAISTFPRSLCRTRALSKRRHCHIPEGHGRLPHTADSILGHCSPQLISALSCSFSVCISLFFFVFFVLFLCIVQVLLFY